MRLKNRWKNHDYIITVCVLVLSFISLILIYSTTYTSQTLQAGSGTFQKQLFFFLLGFIIYFGLSTFDISWLKNKKFILVIYVVTIIALVYVKLFTEKIAGTNRWITIFGMGIQPAEYAKITIILVAAAIAGLDDGLNISKIVSLQKDTNDKQKTFKQLLAEKIVVLTKPLFLVGSIALVSFLIFIQPSMGNTIIIFLIWLSVVFASFSNQLRFLNVFFPLLTIPLISWNIWGINSFFLSVIEVEILNISLVAFVLVLIISLLVSLRSRTRYLYILFAAFVGLVLQPLVLEIWQTNIVTDYQKQRVETFFQSPESDPLDAGYQVRQSKIAIGSGQFDGRGYLKGTQSTLQVLPFAHTDFIFASLAEQFGFVGALILFAVYGCILFRIIWISANTKGEFEFLILIGIFSLLLLNIFINIGMNMGRLPVTGVPLPMISYGGSSVLVNLIGLGLVQSIYSRRSAVDVAESLNPTNSYIR